MSTDDEKLLSDPAESAGERPAESSGEVVRPEISTWALARPAA